MCFKLNSSLLKARILVPVYSTESVSFLVGALSPKEPTTEIHWIQYDEDLTQIKSNIWKHEGEVVHMSPSSSNSTLLFTISQSRNLYS